jgi:hypothetical protein
LPKSIQNYPKTISLRNFKIPPKFDILVFFKKDKFYVQRRHQNWCSPFGFSINK